MAVSLYTSRAVLSILGVEDFGVFSVVGGIVIMFGFLNSAMGASTQRFLSFAIGEKDIVKIKNVFSTSINIHIITAIIILLFSETIGLWFVNSQMHIPSGRLAAANWVYQASVISFIISILGIPYYASIIANEDMNIFSIISIAETILKLIIVFLLEWFSFDKLIFYSLLMTLVTLITQFSYSFACKIKYNEYKHNHRLNIHLIKEMGGFANWNLLGALAGVGYGQGVNIMLNLFFGPTVNAARGLAFQIQGAVNSFYTNFQLAVNPAITKSYAQNDKRYMHQLVYKSTRLSFFLLLIITFPIILETNYILNLWLINIPNFTLIFTRLTLIDILIGSLSGALQTMVQATGRIKLYQILVSGVLLLNLPISYVMLKIGCQPEITFYVSILLSIIALFVRLKILNTIDDFPIELFLKNVLFPVLTVSLVIVFFTLIFNRFVNSSLLNLLFAFSVSIIAVWLIGITKSEKQIVERKLAVFLIRKKNK